MTLPPTSIQMMALLTDEEVVARVLTGDTAVFELLMRRHNQRLFRLARAVVRSADEAEDIVQEAYVRAYAGLSRFEGRASVATWLARITLHEALRRRRRQKTVRALGTEDAEPRGVGDGSDAVVERAAGAEARALLTGAIDGLPAGLRAVVMLRLVEGISTRETAACLRMTEANVKVSLHRARKMLAESVQRRMVPEFRQQFTFDGERCDRIVARVFGRLGVVDV